MWRVGLLVIALTVTLVLFVQRHAPFVGPEAPCACPPTYTPSPTPTTPGPTPTGPTQTATPAPTSTGTATPEPSSTPTVTPTPVPSSTPTRTPVPTATATFTPGPTSTASPAPTATATVPAGVPTPPPLVNAQDPKTACGADPTGVTDSTSCFQSILDGSHDINVTTTGVYKLIGTVRVPSNRNIRCGNGLNQQSSFAFVNTATTNMTMFQFNGTDHNSLFGCQLRGMNYNASGAPVCNLTFQYFIYIQSIGNGGTAGYHHIANNDFNGIGGFNGAILIDGNASNQPPPQHITIEYNTAEHCGYRFVEIDSGTNNTVQHDTLVDCSDGVEQQNASQQDTGNQYLYESLNFSHGDGTATCNGNSVYWNHLTCGAANHISGGTTNYSGNTCEFNSVTGAVGNGIYIGRPGGSCSNSIVPAVYGPSQTNNNTCTGSCTVKCPPGS